MLVTYTTSINEKFPGELISENCSDRYIGTGWIYLLANLLKTSGIDFVPAEIAFKNIQSKTIDPKKILLIQDGKNNIGLKLSQLGVHKFLIINLESPLYDPRFYDSLPEYINGFEWVYSYDGFYRKVPINQSRLTPFFPSHSIDHTHSPKKEKINKVCLIASNKFISGKFEYSLTRNLKQLKRYAIQSLSSEYRESIKNCLHRKRIELIHELAGHGLIDLYGLGWNDLTNLPQDLKTKMEKIIPSIYKGPVANKYATLSSYKFSLCVENIALDGYITEKIIDALAAGSIPIYYGAPDINVTIPPNVIINGNMYTSPSQLTEKILTMSEMEAQEINSNGFHFINNIGQSYSIESMAQNILLKIKAKQSNA